MLRLLACGVLFAFVITSGGAERVFDLSEAEIQQPPPGFRSVLLGQGSPGQWRVILDDTPSLFAPVSPRSPVINKRKVIAQLSTDPTDERYPLLVYDGETYEDFTLTASFKIADGKAAQMAGVAFRIKDDANFYYVRANALDTNVAFVKVANGQLVDRKAVRADLSKGKWHELTIECKGSQVRVLLDGKYLDTFLDSSGQVLDSGKVGFWTKSDSVCYFAETRILYAPKEPFAQILLREVLQKYPRLEGLKIYAAKATNAEPCVIASHDAKDLGTAAGKVERDVIARGVTYYGKDKGMIIVTLPLRDKNGDAIAAVKVLMKSFSGQTEQNAIVRATPVVKRMELRVPTSKDLFE